MLPGIYPCVTAGIEIFHYYFVQAIAKYYKVFVATVCDRFDPGQGVNVIQHPNKMMNSHTAAVTFHQLKCMFALKHEIDLVHIPYSSKSAVQRYHALITKLVLDIPFVLRIHGGGMYPSRPFAFHQMLFDQAAAVIAVSTPIQKEYERRHCRSIDMIPSMLPFNRSPLAQEEIREKWGVENSDMIILFIGSIKKIKGPDLLLDAFLALGREYVEVHRLKLIYAGDGSMRPELEKIAAKSALSSRIRFLGTVPHESVCELYKMADIFCIPSLMEARPLALAEALYNGVPSISSDIATIKNIIKN